MIDATRLNDRESGIQCIRTAPLLGAAASRRGLLAVPALVFMASTAVTILACRSMSSMGGVPMAGGWTLSMAWVRMPGQTWPGAAASFVGMWIAMMTAMMLPCLMPRLLRYRQALERCGNPDLARLVALVGVGYFFVWTLLGIALFPLGIGLAALEMHQAALARAVPIAAAVLVLIAGGYQFSTLKAHYLACCRGARGRPRLPSARGEAAWREGVRLGLHCTGCCANLMAILLVIGIMDLRAMLLVTAALILERLTPAGEQAARNIGIVIIGIGLFLIAQAASS